MLGKIRPSPGWIQVSVALRIMGYRPLADTRHFLPCCSIVELPERPVTPGLLTALPELAPVLAIAVRPLPCGK